MDLKNPDSWDQPLVILDLAPPTGIPVTESVDLRIEESDISFSDDEPVEGDTVRVSAMVHNDGDVEVKNVYVGFYEGDELLGSCVIPIIEPGNFNIATMNFTVSDSAHFIRVIVDPANVIVESNEGNNEASNYVSTSDELCAEYIGIMYASVMLIGLGAMFVLRRRKNE